MKVNRTTFFLIVFILFCFSVPVEAQETNTLTLETYFAPPSQEFKALNVRDLRLTPSEDLGNACVEQNGSVYFNQDRGEINICKAEIWTSIGTSYWKKYLSDSGDSYYVEPLQGSAADVWIGISREDSNAAKLIEGVDAYDYSLNIEAPDEGSQSNGGIVAFGKMGEGNLMALGIDSRFMWYPRKAAIRAGAAFRDLSGDVPSAALYEDSRIGNYSAGFGANIAAGGDASFATGSMSDNIQGAAGSHSVAMGSNLEAVGDTNMVFGINLRMNFAFELFNDFESVFAFGSGVDRLSVGALSPPWQDIEIDPRFIVGNNGVLAIAGKDGSFGIRATDDFSDIEDENNFPMILGENVDSSMHVLGDVMFLEDREPQILFAQEGEYADEISLGTTDDNMFRIRSLSERSSSSAQMDILMIKDGKVGINMDSAIGEEPVYTLDVNGSIHSGGGDYEDIVKASGFIQTVDSVLPALCEIGQIKYSGGFLYGCDASGAWKTFDIQIPTSP